ncbi:hypothetical protein As57867_006295, partial [Aphanomyces stellatus]
MDSPSNNSPSITIDAVPVDNTFEYSTPPAQVPVMYDVMETKPLDTDANGLVVGQWKASVFACFVDFVPNCLMAWCCPCVTVAQVAHRLNMFPFLHVLAVWGLVYGLQVIFYFVQIFNLPHFGFVCDGRRCGFLPVGSFAYIFLALACSVVLCIMLTLFRIRFRRAFAIPGSELEDCCCAFWCSCCVHAQMATHASA